ncbi:hypothetical protein BV25DRAFT_1918841 [Artomyces pyxidatus]|uniref:Uncharacterized protein n=1 Tax=Artomyces pyxidatus TaxID=48021 RepID=A0ACB8SSZ8_9AGAM|nr:hypothetical protein BV25DRAFT_1918841 [Artomyces pyxidatus]
MQKTKKETHRHTSTSPLAPRPKKPARSPSSSKRQKTSGNSTSPAESLTLEALRDCAQAGVQQHKQAQNTRKTSEDQVKRMRRWSAEFSSTEAQLPQKDAGTEIDGDRVAGSDPEFAVAFDGKPKACSAEALVLYLSYECFVQDRKASTAWSAYSAIKKYCCNVI